MTHRKFDWQYWLYLSITLAALAVASYGFGWKHGEAAGRNNAALNPQR